MIKKKGIKQLVEEGEITKEKLRSILFLGKTGMFFSSTEEDALYVAEQIERLDNNEEIGV